MQGVEFEEGGNRSSGYSAREHRGHSGIIGFLVKKGIAKTEKQAEIILIFMFFVLIALSVLVLQMSGRSSERLSKEEIKQRLEMTRTLPQR